jgi:hypothetical protein
MAVYSPADDARRLKEAMKGVGTDNTTLIDILAHRPRAHIQAIAAEYQKTYGKELITKIISDTSGHFRDVLVGLVKPFGVYCAELVYQAMDGAGTNEAKLIDVLTTLYSYEMQQLVQAWEKIYFKEEGFLTQRIRRDCSGYFSRTLCECTKVVRTIGDPSRVELDAMALYCAGEKRIGTDEETFVEIFTKWAPDYLQQVSKSYQAKHKKTLEEVVKSETSGNFRDALMALLTPRPKYVAKRIHEAIKGLGTNDSVLVRMVVLNDKDILRQAAAIYATTYGEPMAKAIKGDTTGSYQDLLIALIN